ncbi:hypothetical protein [Pseudomonas sp. B21-053]|uniref:hypothetical protein n=1 Tax=Pseudomonas sp. B21-053 TaxID=2895493 RepID=UPI00222E422E|nr:hypothetical protein [Pseudomonas sp. B21-053]UZE12321.1 hypothetical protein LOY68_01555 [Pseudomonas sp. B21-053]
MTGQEVYNILVARNVTKLFHANSVKTSLSLLGLGGLASRELVESSGLGQTSQITDPIDRKYGILGDVFMDTVDIHQRVSNRNKYGPVMFVMDIAVLAALPSTAQVLITRLNPSKWDNTINDAQRYFLTSADLIAGLDVGNFDQMLVVRTDDKIVHFGNYLQAVILDEPKLSSGKSPEFSTAETELNAALLVNGLGVKTSQRLCAPCGCVSSYSAPATRIPWFYRTR